MFKIEFDPVEADKYKKKLHARQLPVLEKVIQDGFWRYVLRNMVLCVVIVPLSLLNNNIPVLYILIALPIALLATLALSGIGWHNKKKEVARFKADPTLTLDAVLFPPGCIKRIAIAATVSLILIGIAAYLFTLK